MQYMLLIYGTEDAWEALGEDERNAMYEEYSALSPDLESRRAYVSAHELQPVAAATTVSVRDGETIVSDGPFAETKEILGGYYLIDVPDLDAALEWAARMPNIEYGSVEVRPVMVFSDAEMPPA